MSNAIPGGRQRANSEGDILDSAYHSVTTFRASESGSAHHQYEDSSGNNHEDIWYDSSRSCTTVPSTRSSLRNGTSSSFRGQSNTKFRLGSTPHLELSQSFDSDEGSAAISPGSSNSSKHHSSSGKFFSFKSFRRAVKRIRGDESHKINSLKAPLSKNNHRPPSKGTSALDSNGIDPQTSRSRSDIDINMSHTTFIEDTDPLTVPRWKNTPGTIGIYNHRNSCFMNAVLQCLSSTDTFTEYLVKDHYKADFKNNKSTRKSQKHGGEVTEQLSKLFKSLWTGSYKCDVSKEFKSIAGKVNSQYSGDHQQDALEFLLWLLDTVHEDVCMPNQKKAKQSKNPSVRTEKELAQDAAAVTGESFVHNLFQALHSSTLTCPSCGRHSNTFDPYLCVSLPLPQRCPRDFNVIIMVIGCISQEVLITVDQTDTVLQLREAIVKDSYQKDPELILCQITDSGFGVTYSDTQPLSDIPEGERVYCWEIGLEEEEPSTTRSQTSAHDFATDTALLMVVHVVVTGSHAKRFSSPCVLQVPRDISWKSLQKDILRAMGDMDHYLAHMRLQSNMFDLKVCEVGGECSYLDRDVDMPLYTQDADSALSSLGPDCGPPHIKLLVEWDQHYKQRMGCSDKEEIDVTPSVTEAKSRPQSHEAVSMDECLKLYTQVERMDASWLCPHCKEQQRGAAMSLGLWSLPQVLVLHLKRFKQIGNSRSKLNTLVDFPVDDLDMSPYLISHDGTRDLSRDDTTYELLGVCNHYGDMMGGHYTAYCRGFIDGKWREFNDHKVSSLNSPIVTENAYILFYQRRSLSKENNRRRFTGDHWVFSLPLETSEESTSADISNNNVVTRSINSRSVSPTSRRKGNRGQPVPSRPLTPQPSKSRAPCSGDDTRPASPPPPGYEQTAKLQPGDKRLIENHSRGREKNSSSVLTACVGMSSSGDDRERMPPPPAVAGPRVRPDRQSRSQTLPGRGRPPRGPLENSDAVDSVLMNYTEMLSQHPVNRHDNHISNNQDHLGSELSVVLTRCDLNERRGSAASHASGVSDTPASSLQVQLTSTSQQPPSVGSSDLVRASDARRRMAQLVIDSRPATDSVRSSVRGYHHQTSLDLARRHPVDMSAHTPALFTSDDLRGAEAPDYTTRIHNQRNNSSNIASVLNPDQRPERYHLRSTDERASRQSELKRQLSDSTSREFNKLAYRHFGDLRQTANQQPSQHRQPPRKRSQQKP